MDDFDRRLLRALQHRVPLVREPFAVLAGELGADEPRVIRAIADLRARGVIREISAIFDATALGYDQALVALRVPPGRLDKAGRIAAEHPGVSHCYARRGSVNLWLTLSTSPASRLGLPTTADALARDAGADACMLLPTLRRYKLRVAFDLDDDAPAMPAEEPGESAEISPTPPPGGLTDEQRAAVRALQVDLPARADPFAGPAAAEGLHPDMLLVHAADFLAARWMRRYAAVLHHRAAGAGANVLVAWKVAEPAADRAGARCARQANVSHCYLRPTAPDWPYNLYTMIHGRNEQHCRATVDEILATTDLDEYVELWTTSEYAKRRVRLFTDDEARWEAGR